MIRVSNSAFCTNAAFLLDIPKPCTTTTAGMKSTNECLMELAYEMYLLEEMTYNFRHEVLEVICLGRDFDVHEHTNTGSVQLMQRVKVKALQLLSSNNQKLFLLPLIIQNNKQLKDCIKVTLAAVKAFCLAAEEAMVLPTVVQDNNTYDKRRAIFAAKLKKELGGQALWESLDPMCTELKKAESMIKKIRFHECIRAARQT
ncbi:hypothetical protein D6C80_09024 [Aureobasidium pullulans]|nr:hypothetical protein D6C80_09024 [Aureobasidium pullulans]